MAKFQIRDKTAICGVGNSKYGRFPASLSPLILVVEAFKNALDDAGLRCEDVDGILINIGTPIGVDYDQVAEGLGLDISFSNQTWQHGRQLGTVLAEGALAAHGGLANYVACVCGINWVRAGGGTVGAPGQFQDDREIGGAHFENPPYGMSSPGAAWAMAARKYFDRYGATSSDLAEVCVTQRKHALLNPQAFMREPLTVEQHQASRFICEPFHLYDYCLTVSGACVVIVTTAERARDCRKPPVYLMGMQSTCGGRREATGGRPGLGIHQQDENEPVTTPRDRRAFEMAGIGPADVDGLYCYDAFSTAVWLTLERFGYCKPGEAWQFCKDGRIELGGELPVNTNGGLLSEAHVSAWNHICEIVRQLRGECGERQIADADIIQWATNRGDSVIFRR